MNSSSISLTELSSLRGRVALVTGGAGHLGRTAAETLAELGAGLVVVDLDAARCAAIAEDLRGRFGVPAFGLAADLARESDVRAIAPRVSAEFGRLDVLINCAALVGTSGLKGWAVPFLQQDVGTWRQALEVNLTAPFTLVQTCTELLRQNGKGSVINISSIYGVVGPDWSLYEGTSLGNPAAYGASKGGLGQLTRWLATTLGPEVRVNTVVPGGIARGQAPAFVERYVRKVPLGRMATEQDFKGVIAFLASDLSAYVTGQEICIDGGFTAW